MEDKPEDDVLRTVADRDAVVAVLNEVVLECEIGTTSRETIRVERECLMFVGWSDDTSMIKGEQLRRKKLTSSGFSEIAKIRLSYTRRFELLLVEKLHAMGYRIREVSHIVKGLQNTNYSTFHSFIFRIIPPLMFWNAHP